MAKQLKFSDYHAGKVDDDNRVLEWELGLPTDDELTPLSQSLVPPALASAFSISPEPYRTVLDVNRASRDTLSTLRGHYSKLTDFKSFDEEKGGEFDGDETDLTRDGSDSRKSRRTDAEEEDSGCGAPATAATMKRRLVWTPQLHKRFVDVVAHLGIKNAVPKTIMQLMNVEGLTRENVASHLQKYRLYLKRMQGLSNEGPSASDHLFASTPMPHSLNESSGGNGGGSACGNGSGHGMPIPMAYGPQMVPMPVYGGTGMPQPGAYSGYDYSMMQPRDWSGNKYACVNPYQQFVPSEK